MTDNPDVSRLMVQLFDYSVEAMLILDMEGRILYVNQATADFGGTTVPAMQGRLLWDVFPDTAGPAYESHFRRSAREQVPVTIEFYFPPADLWFEVRFYPSPEAVALFAANITERKEASETIRLSEEKYRRLLDSVDQGYAQCEMVWDENGKPINYRFLEVNPAFERMSGLADAGGRLVKELVPDLETSWIERYGQVARTGEALRFQQGSEVMGRVFDVFVMPTGGNGFLILFTDITERIRREQENEALNIRLRRAMQETHHRVKNNLQVISALVEMQAVDAINEATATPLRRINQHVQTLSVIHDLLTRNANNDSNLSHLGVRSVLLTLLPLLQNTIGNRRIAANIEDVSLTAQKAASLALLVSECVSNAVKHGKGDIEVTLRNMGYAARLEICDDGSGFPPNFDARKAANTGLQLIESAGCWDLGGEVQYDNHDKGGGRITIIFPLEPAANP